MNPCIECGTNCCLAQMEGKECKAMNYEARPHGEWYKTPNPNHSPFDSTSEVIYMCSQCAYSSGERIAETWHFCPNCGASMVKEGEADGKA